MLVVRRIAIVVLIAIVTTTFAILPTPVEAQGKDPCPKNDKKCWVAHKKHQEDVRIWWREVRAQQVRRQNWIRLLAYLASQNHYRPGQCGGSLPPCWVMMRESRGNIHAQNPRSTASGKWQIIDGTWGNHRGYRKARYAPEWVQDERARMLWANGRGCGHWSSCG